jgi:ATP-binding cassette subfamily B protein
VGVPVIFIYAFIFFKQVRKRFQAADESEGYLTTVLEESLNGIRVVRAFAREDYEVARFERAADDYRAKCRKLITVLAYYWASSDLLCLTQMAIVFIFGIGWTIRARSAWEPCWPLAPISICCSGLSVKWDAS